jgi:hypothetical protein
MLLSLDQIRSTMFITGGKFPDSTSYAFDRDNSQPQTHARWRRFSLGCP